MTSRRLPETDIAKICVRPESEQYKLLRGKKSFRPPHSLEATRRNLAALVGVETPMFPAASVEPEAAIKALRNSISRKEDLAPNILRAEAILEFRKRCLGRAASEPMRGHRVTIDNTIYLTHSLIFEMDGKPFIPFFDLRKSGHLTADAREFVFAMNYHLLVDALEEFRDFGLVILNYWEESPQNFGLTPLVFSGVPRYSFEELTTMVARTYEIWLEVLNERKGSEEPDEGYGPLFA